MPSVGCAGLEGAGLYVLDRWPPVFLLLPEGGSWLGLAWCIGWEVFRDLKAAPQPGSVGSRARLGRREGGGGDVSWLGTGGRGCPGTGRDLRLPRLLRRLTGSGRSWCSPSSEMCALLAMYSAESGVSSSRRSIRYPVGAGAGAVFSALCGLVTLAGAGCSLGGLGVPLASWRPVAIDCLWRSKDSSDALDRLLAPCPSLYSAAIAMETWR